MAGATSLAIAATAAVLLVLCPLPGSALVCYECNSHNDSRCSLATPPDIFKKDCSEHIEGSKYTMCRKIVQSIEFEVNGLLPDSRTIRSCGWDESNYKGKCYQRSGFGGRQEVCSCLTDFCNGAPTATSLVSSLVTACLSVTSLLIGRAVL